MWQDFGFKDNLYATPPLAGTTEGSQLLVGRDDEVARLQTHWSSLDTHASMEGDNGVGKTSLVAVAAYRAMVSHSLGKSEQMILPLAEPFQMRAGEDLEEQILFVIARSIIHYEDAFKAAGKKLPKIEDVRKWLDDPILRGGGGNVTVLGTGVGGNYSQSANTGGFSRVGFRDTVKGWLREIFPSKNDGAFVGVIDNLELLETSQDARKALEAMRDTVLALPGVKWVLCGANGIVRSAVGSQRLTGVIGDPLQVKPLGDTDIPLVIQRRIEAHRLRADAIAPVEPGGFAHLYQVAGRNLRIALKHAQDFSLWLHAQTATSTTSEDRIRLLEVWLAEQAERYEADTKTITPAGWTFFDSLLASGGSCSPGDFAQFDFNSQQAMRPYVKQLEDANLVHSTIDESDQRRRTIVVTSNGWLVHYKRAGFTLPE
jgi:DNA-binding MarR family transcriptional regulator